MSARLEKINPEKDASFFIGIFQDNFDRSTWHYHNNYEISFITEGSGNRIVADSIQEFHPGDLVIIGPNLPHVWIPEKETQSPSNRTLEMVFLQFTSEVLPMEIMLLPEFAFIKKALELSRYGIQINSTTLNEVSEIMLQLPYLGNFERMLNFYKLMDTIGRSNSNLRLASDEYLKIRIAPTNKRIAIIHNYLMSNYKEEVNLKRLAELVSLAEGSLCRFFKKFMGMTVFEYLNQIKIEFACKLLMDPGLSIMEICFDSGFNNISHFNYQFKKIMKKTPREYRKNFNLPTQS